MKVVSVRKFSGEEVEVDDVLYERFSSDCWYRKYGESKEPCYTEEPALEAAYQEYMRVSPNRQATESRKE